MDLPRYTDASTIATVTPAPTYTLTPTFTPTSTPTTAVYEARCPLVVSQILQDAIPSDNVIHINELARAKDVTYIIHS